MLFIGNAAKQETKQHAQQEIDIVAATDGITLLQPELQVGASRREFTQAQFLSRSRGILGEGPAFCLSPPAAAAAETAGAKTPSADAVAALLLAGLPVLTEPQWLTHGKTNVVWVKFGLRSLSGPLSPPQLQQSPRDMRLLELHTGSPPSENRETPSLNPLGQAAAAVEQISLAADVRDTECVYWLGSARSMQPYQDRQRTTPEIFLDGDPVDASLLAVCAGLSSEGLRAPPWRTDVAPAGNERTAVTGAVQPQLPLWLTLLGALPSWALAAADWPLRSIIAPLPSWLPGSAGLESTPEPLKRINLVFFLPRLLPNARYSLQLLPDKSGLLGGLSLGYATLNGHPLGEYAVSTNLADSGKAQGELSIPPGVLVEGPNVVSIIDFLGGNASGVVVREEVLERLTADRPALFSPWRAFGLVLLLVALLLILGLVRKAHVMMENTLGLIDIPILWTQW
ncbi:hypothetical protein cyc_08721 [Cyclospora cayetanensis]|uniref:Transmembrane protein n=1 Tax=Cyclospora cayetanensis TaxID=88456 RepID=A0A1D3CS60_9EIME|nr:hypothetical protein cyc_08721 [Cyclospora cayetanensis]